MEFKNRKLELELTIEEKTILTKASNLLKKLYENMENKDLKTIYSDNIVFDIDDIDGIHYYLASLANSKELDVE